MKCALILLCVLVSVYAENCRSDSDCHDTQCTDSTHDVHCISVGLLQRECVCSDGETAGKACSDQNDCSDHSCLLGSSEHCIDGHCRCGYIGGLPGIDKKRKVCRICSAKLRTRCPDNLCNVGLCVGDCFQSFHTRVTEE